MTPSEFRRLADTATAAAATVEAFERAVTGGRDVAVTDLVPRAEAGHNDGDTTDVMPDGGEAAAPEKTAECSA
jgi:hypothetical protein